MRRYGILAFALTSVVILGILTYFWVVPGLRGYATLKRCGINVVEDMLRDQATRILDDYQQAGGRIYNGQAAG